MVIAREAETIAKQVMIQWGLGGPTLHVSALRDVVVSIVLLWLVWGHFLPSVNVMVSLDFGLNPV